MRGIIDRRARTRGVPLEQMRLDTPSAVHDESYDGADEEDDEQDLRDPGGTRRDSAEAEHSRDQRDNQEHDGIVQHGLNLHPDWIWMTLDEIIAHWGGTLRGGPAANRTAFSAPARLH
jgi:hypothetical protein